MISKEDIRDLYVWAKDTSFPLKKAPTIEVYSNKSIDYYWVKSVKKSTIIRHKFMNDKVAKIYDNEEILFSNYVIFYGGTVLSPHKDPDILRHPYKRIQIPLYVPEKGECYMKWIDGGKITWKNGVAQVCEVCKFKHEAYNNSKEPIEFLFLDVKLDTEVEL